MVRHPEVEVMATKEEAQTHTSLETGGRRATHTAPWGGGHLDQSEARAED